MIPPLRPSRKGKTIEMRAQVLARGLEEGGMKTAQAASSRETTLDDNRAHYTVGNMSLYMCPNPQRAQHQEGTLTHTMNLGDYDVSA